MELRLVSASPVPKNRDLLILEFVIESFTDIEMQRPGWTFRLTSLGEGHDLIGAVAQSSQAMQVVKDRKLPVWIHRRQLTGDVESSAVASELLTVGGIWKAGGLGNMIAYQRMAANAYEMPCPLFFPKLLGKKTASHIKFYDSDQDDDGDNNGDDDDDNYNDGPDRKKSNATSQSNAEEHDGKARAAGDNQGGGDDTTLSSESEFSRLCRVSAMSVAGRDSVLSLNRSQRRALTECITEADGACKLIQGPPGKSHGAMRCVR